MDKKNMVPLAIGVAVIALALIIFGVMRSRAGNTTAGTVSAENAPDYAKQAQQGQQPSGYGQGYGQGAQQQRQMGGSGGNMPPGPRPSAGAPGMGSSGGGAYPTSGGPAGAPPPGPAPR